jgi:hypothetical protein
MRIKLSELKRIIAEEVDRAVRRSAGFCGGLGLGGRARGSIEVPPLGLGGSEEEDEEGHGKEQEKRQLTARLERIRGKERP